MLMLPVSARLSAATTSSAEALRSAATESACGRPADRAPDPLTVAVRRTVTVEDPKFAPTVFADDPVPGELEEEKVDPAEEEVVVAAVAVAVEDEAAERRPWLLTAPWSASR